MWHNWIRRWAPAAALACGAAAAQTGPADASRYPERPVALVVPTAAGGGTDTVARIVADALSRHLGQAFVVDNRPGANGIVGIEAGARAAPDGYRLLFAYAAALVVNPSLYKRLPYDPVADFAPIAQIGRAGNLLLARQDLPVSTLRELVDYVRGRAAPLSYCSWGKGSGGHLAMESLGKQAGIALTHVPYKGTAGCVQDLLGGHLDAGFADISSTVDLVRAGRLKALAHSGPSRLPMLPDVPTMTQAGYPFHNYSWYGLLAPARTAPAIVARLNEAVNAVLREPGVVQRLRALNLSDLPQTTPEQFGRTIESDLRNWAALAQSVGLQPE